MEVRLVKVLMHACCGPCLLEPYDAMSDHDVTVCYANPNIHPAEEYRRRADTLLQYATDAGIAVVEMGYEPDSWARATQGASGKAARCRACYRLRLGIVAQEAVRRGFDAVATTLTVSPYQDQEAVREIGEAVCAEAGVGFMATDFRDRFAETSRRSRELGMYRQNYCGCHLSMKEAEEGRQARKRDRLAR